MKLGFIDFEASGLSEDSFPLEIGWTKDGENVESYYIHPDPSWNLKSWSSAAQNLHGIELKSVFEFGVDTKIVSQAMNSALNGYILLSDSASHDIRWANMIFQSAKIERKFKIVSVEKFLKQIGLSDKDIFESFKYGRSICPPTNSVVDDSKFLYFSTRHALSKRGL